MSQKLSDKEISNAFEKLKITPEKEILIKENSDNLDYTLKTMILNSINKLQGKKKCPDIDSFFDFLSKTAAINVAKDTLADSISQLITLKVLVNEKTPNDYDSLYLSNVYQKKIEPTPETRSDKIDADSVQTLTPITAEETPRIPIQTETPLLKNVKQIHKPLAQQETLISEKFETLLTRHLEISHNYKKNLNHILKKIVKQLQI